MDSPHTVHVRGAVSALEPRIETFLWRLSINIVSAEKKAATEHGIKAQIGIKY